MKQRLALIVSLATPLLLLAYLATSFAQETRSTDWKSLEIQNAEASLALAQAQLAVAIHQNQEAAESVPKETMASLQAEVQLAASRLKQLQGGELANPYAPMIAAAEARVKGAEQEYQESLRANSIDQSAVPEVMVQREQAKIAVAKSRLAMLQQLNGQPVDVRLQWEIRQLQDEVRALWNRPLIED